MLCRKTHTLPYTRWTDDTHSVKLAWERGEMALVWYTKWRGAHCELFQFVYTYGSKWDIPYIDFKWSDITFRRIQRYGYATHFIFVQYQIQLIDTRLVCFGFYWYCCSFDIFEKFVCFLNYRWFFNWMDRFVRERDTMRLISAGQAINKTLKLPQMWKHERITIYATFSTVRPKPQPNKKFKTKWILHVPVWSTKYIHRNSTEISSNVI